MLIFLASLIPINIAEKPLAELLLDYTSSLDSPDAFKHEDKYPTGFAEQYIYIYVYVAFELSAFESFLVSKTGIPCGNNSAILNFEVLMCMNKKRKHLIEGLRIYSRYMVLAA